MAVNAMISITSFLWMCVMVDHALLIGHAIANYFEWLIFFGPRWM